MQTARNYIPRTAVNIARIFGRMPCATVALRPLPSTATEINRYVEELLTPEEKRICDMATD